MAEGGEMNGNGGNNAIEVHLAAGNEPASRRRLRSLVWNDFTKERRPDGNCVAICNHCKKQLSASSRSGTTHLKNHLATCTNTKVRKRKKLLVRRLVMKGDRNDGADVSHFDQELSRQDLARMIVLHGYPFTIVHHVGFKAFVKNLQPQFKLMSHDVVRADCMKIYEDGKIKLREMLEKLPCRVSLTVDMWRSNEDVEYVCLTCHYIHDDWKLKRKILNFLHVETPTPGEEISKTIAEKLLDWNLHRKLFSVILDNCNESDVVARDLPEFVLLKGSLPLNGEFFHLRAAASVLNVIAHDISGLVCDIVNKVRDSVQYVRSTQATLNAFHAAARKVGAPQKPLVSDVQNNWITAYLMLETVCECQAAFTCFADCDSAFTSLSAEEWDLAKAVTECLYVFYHAIDKFTDVKVPTSNLYFNDICGIHLLLKGWRTSELPVISTMASQILENYEKYWGRSILVMAIASILDPRYKMKSIEYFFNKIYDEDDGASVKIEEIRKYLKNLYEGYVKQSNDISNNQAFLCYYENNSCGSGAETKEGGESKTASRTLFDARRGLDQYLQETSSSQPQKTDLDLYLEEAVYLSKGSEDNFNILAWWKFHAAKYPVLSMMARDILGIPISVVAIDADSRVLNQYLSSLDPVTVQGLICGQDWLRDEFEVQVEPQGSVEDASTIPVPISFDGDGDECMMPANIDDFSHQNQGCG